MKQSVAQLKKVAKNLKGRKGTQKATKKLKLGDAHTILLYLSYGYLPFLSTRLCLQCSPDSADSSSEETQPATAIRSHLYRYPIFAQNILISPKRSTLWMVDSFKLV